MDFLPHVQDILDLFSKQGRKRRRRKRFLKLLNQLTILMQETDGWKHATSQLWTMANNNLLPKTVRRPEDVKNWLFAVVVLLQTITQKQMEETNATSDSAIPGSTIPVGR